jgi:hypothetical protein
LSRRDQMKVAWHEVPGNKRKADPSLRDKCVMTLPAAAIS